MKRIVSLVLAAVLVLAPCVQGFATDLESKQQEAVSQDESSLVNPMTREGGTPEDGLTVGTPEDPADSKDSGEENGGGTPGDPSDAEPAEGPDAGTEIIMEGEPEVTEAASDVKGQIDVYIMQALAFKSDITFTVSLTGTAPAVDTKSKEITFKAGILPHYSRVLPLIIWRTEVIHFPYRRRDTVPVPVRLTYRGWPIS